MATPLAGFLADIQITSPPGVSIPANTALTDSGDHTTFYLPYNSTYRVWDKAASFTFQTSPDGSTGWTNTSPKTVIWGGGRVTFPSAVTGATPSTRISVGKYFPLASIGSVTSWNAQLAAKSVDATTLKGVGGTPWEDYQLTTLGGTVALKKWWVDNTYFSHVTARDLLVLSCLASDGHHYDMYGYFTDASIKDAVVGLVETDLNFKAVDVVSYQ
jgi:hypothetical protein